MCRADPGYAVSLKGFTIKPSAGTTYFAPVNILDWDHEAVRKITEFYCIRFIATAVSIPSTSPPRSISMRTASGFLSLAQVTASSDVAALPHC